MSGSPCSSTSGVVTGANCEESDDVPTVGRGTSCSFQLGVKSTVCRDSKREPRGLVLSPRRRSAICPASSHTSISIKGTVGTGSERGPGWEPAPSVPTAPVRSLSNSTVPLGSAQGPGLRRTQAQPEAFISPMIESSESAKGRCSSSRLCDSVSNPMQAWRVASSRLGCST